MSSAGSIVYLHGMGGARSDWSAALHRLDEATVLVAPSYADLLAPDAEITPEPSTPVDEPAPAGDGARADYVQRQRVLGDAIRQETDSLPEGTAWPSGLPRPGDLSLRLPLARLMRSSLFGLDQVGRYLDDSDRRRMIRERVRPVLLTAQRPLVVIAHSLGSAVALDALAEPRVHVDLLITAGSPLGHEAVHDELSIAEDFPYDRVGGWINLVHVLDPIPLGRGLHPRFPAAHDAFISPVAGAPTGADALPWAWGTLGRALTAHLDTTYLATTTMQRALDHALAQGART